MKRGHLRVLKLTLFLREAASQCPFAIHEKLNHLTVYSTNEEPRVLTDAEWTEFAEACDLAEEDDEIVQVMSDG